jgi:putative ABC transport system substrate-binding protein
MVILTVALLAGPPLVRAQSAKVHRVALVWPSGRPAPGDRTAATNLIQTALRQLGYVEGQNLVLERRFAEGRLDRLPGLVRDVLQRGSDVIVASSPAVVEAVKGATSTVPIVMMVAADPVAEGWVISLARPGRNITGVVIAADTQLVDKRLQLLKEAVPLASRIAVLATAERHVQDQVREAERAASSLGVALVVVEARDGNYKRAFATLVTSRPHALVVPASPILNRDRRQIIDLAATHRLPAIYQWRDHVEDGGLMAYGPSLPELCRRVATYVDRLLKGAKPADLPVERPTKFELVVSLRTAKALGLAVPQSILSRADEIIE